MTIVLSYTISRSIQEETPTSGGVVTVDPNSNDVSLLMTPAGTLALLEIDFPDDNHSILGQRVDIWSSHEVTALTCTGTAIIGGVSTPITINNAPNTLLADSMASFIRVGSLSWTGTSL